MKKTNFDILFFLTLIAGLLLSFYLAEIVLPFLIGLLLAVLSNPLIKKIQKKIKNRNLSVSIYLLSVFIAFTLVIFIFGAQITNDFKRLNNAVVTYTETNSEEIDAVTAKIKNRIDNFISDQNIEYKIDSIFRSIKETPGDSLFNKIDTDALKTSLSNFSSVFKSEENNLKPKKNINWLIVFLASFPYFIYILFTFKYFEERYNKYFPQDINSKAYRVFKYFKDSFIPYFKQRGTIALIYFAVFLVSFLILKVPGAILFAITGALLTFIPFLNLLLLIPLIPSIIILSIEGSGNFITYSIIILIIYLIMILVEQIILIPKIMLEEAKLNPAVLMLSGAVFGYLFGLFGILITIPLTALILAYIKNLLIERKKLIENEI